MRRRPIMLFLVPLMLFGALFLLRHQILVVGTKICLNKTFEQKVAFKKVSARSGKICIQGLHVRDKQMILFIEEVEFAVNFKEAIAHPQNLIAVFKRGLSSWDLNLLALKNYGTGFRIQNGILQLDDQRYYFQFENEEKNDEIGTLAITHDPSLKDHPFLEAQLYTQDDQLKIQLLIDNVPSHRLLPLAAFVAPGHLSGLSEAQGQVQLKANLIIDNEGQIGEIATHFAFENFQLIHPKQQIAVQTKKLIGALKYPFGSSDLPLWKQMDCKVLLEQGNLLWGEKLGLFELEGSLALNPDADPKLLLKGELIDEGKPLHLQLEGKGAAHEDHAYWLEFALNLNNNQGIDCDAFLSICRPELDNLVVQLESSNLIPQQVEMLKDYFAKSNPKLKEWEIKEGSVGGKLVALFEKGDLAHFEIQNLIGTNIALVSETKEEPLLFNRIEGEGRLFDTLNFEIDLLATDFFSFLSPEFKQAYSNYRYDDTAHLSLNLQFRPEAVETSAQVDFIEQKQTIRFGYKSKTPFPTSIEEISEGWVHSDNLTHMLYGPFVKLADENLNLYGTVDLLGSYDGKKIECLVQVDEFLAKHPLLDLKAAAIGERGKTQGRAKFTYDLSTGALSGTVPIRHGEGYDRSYGLHFEDITADIIFSPQLLKGHVISTDISFDRLNLLKKTQFDFSYEKELLLTSVFGQIALPSTAEFFISSPKFNGKTCDFTLLHEKEIFARFTGSKEEIWKGNLNIKPTKENFDIRFGYDPRTEIARLGATGAGIQIECQKQGLELLIEKLQFKDISLKGVLAKAEDGLSISNFELQRQGAAVRGSGNLTIDLPQEDQSFALRSDLAIEVDVAEPFPIQFKTTHPFKIAYSPKMGLMMSDLDFIGAGSHVNIGQLEYLVQSQQAVANRCSYKFSEELISHFCDSGVLPSFLPDFNICKEVAGKLNCAVKKGKTTLEGTLSSEVGPLTISAEWKDGAGELSLGDAEQKENLSFKVHRQSDQLHVDAVKGTLYNFTADLKKLGKEQLKGHLGIDFSSFSKLFNLPLNHYLNLWKAGKGYQFEGVFTPKQRFSEWSFKGKMKGRDIEWSGYQLGSVDAKIEIEPGIVTIENFDLSDDAGKVWIGEAALTKDRNQEWIFTIPIAEVRGFQPSLLNKLGIEENNAKPLVVKTATLRNVRGKIDDLKSITGSGRLHFTNIMKTGQRELPLKMPTQFLAKLGLDGALFVPDSGDMEYVIENGKCFLREVQSLMTEKRRSEFLAPQNQSMGYIDFEGNLFINLQVKQNVLRNIPAPLNLQVRGKWNDPELMIK